MCDAGSPHQSAAKVVTNLEEQLYNCQLRNEAGKFFIPEGELNRILNEDSVYQSLLQLSGQYPDFDIEACTQQICSQQPSFRKIFAILTLLNLVENIVTFVRFGVNDDFLPMPDPRRLLLPGKPSDADEKRWRAWKDLLESLPKHLYRLFHVFQWCALAPVFDNQGQVKHYSFTPDHVLPFLENKEHTSTPDAAVESDPLNGRVRYGGFSEVRKVRIHPDHYRFGRSEVRNPDHLFAVKRLQFPDREELTWEVGVYQRFRNLHDYSIIPLLMTYEIRQNTYDEFPSDYCLVFPWATGDLSAFWQTNPTLVGNRRIIPWISTQCYELSRAVSLIHGSSSDMENDTFGSESFYGRHGDLKPRNILWFSSVPKDNKSWNPGKLVLGDFGLTQFHRRSSRSDLTSSNLATSLTYRPPEIDEAGRISRSMDIWALGCIYLEFVTWFLKGFDAVDSEFREARSELDIYGIRSDTFFRVASQGSKTIATLKPQVTSWFKHLASNKNCSRYLFEFLSLVQNDMLAPDPHRRIVASELSRELDRMQRKCVKDATYYQIAHDGPRMSSANCVAKPRERHNILRVWRQRLRNKFC
ncbi:kinase-like domain-containing protein [Xylariaceae sp. FL0662B]|nr:kinase-like domain-containing protein [Xylariaceae sp. FL0662B]